MQAGKRFDSRSVFLAALVLVLAGVGQLKAESTPEATQWLKKMKSAYERSYRVSYRSDMSVIQQGESIGLTVKGATTQADRNHLRMELAITMSMGEMNAQMAMLGVIDGKTFWLESDNPMTGGKQVTRMPVDMAGDMSGGGMGLAGGVSGFDPVGQIEQMVAMFDFEMTSRSEDRVTLQATMTEEILADLHTLLPDAEGMERFVLVLDEGTAFPLEMRMGGETPFMTMVFNDLEFVEPGSLDPAIFSYTPPEGTEVVDMGARMSEAD
jgi:hypothetical protein